MKLSYAISKRALKDLDEIWDYTVETWSINQATLYYEIIISEIEKQCKSPLTGKSLEMVKANYRARMVKSHMIIFRIEKEKVVVVRILHQQMDIDSILNE